MNDLNLEHYAVSEKTEVHRGYPPFDAMSTQGNEVISCIQQNGNPKLRSQNQGLDANCSDVNTRDTPIALRVFAS